MVMPACSIPWGVCFGIRSTALRAVHGFCFQYFAPDTLAAHFGPPKDDRGGDIDRGISSDENSDENGERKIAQHGAAEEIEGADRKQCCAAGENRAAQRLVD